MTELNQEVDQRRVRFSDAHWYNSKEKLDISIIGLGGIGSYLAYFLSRIGNHNFYIYDYDVIDETNMAGQFYPIIDIGLPKVEACSLLMERFSGSNPNMMAKFTKDSMVTPYMFSPLDNMDVRKLAFDKWVEEYGDSNEALFVDCRMLMESLEVYFVTKDRIEDYRKQLFPDAEVEEAPCSAKATSHCGAMCASLAVAGFTNYLSNLYTDTDIREVPFKLRVDLPFMSFKLPAYETSTSII